ncbi:HWE histidine kinase domain-containing protein [Parvularcula dongshanensis]|uniref:histidine kinase n=1 Tax=Parvularcula dongshanensis TaxID=1173995 RepID=A0A840I0B8_9PROT|nr:HWE histidine kinase domain-containing protein [Parvularcula dongshanensis]MBB4657694.1 light-regulated signal transduction histidine kinase (bacteriophytochrome) [Parvularcula dongshanensis]
MNDPRRQSRQQSQRPEAADLTTCDREPIHIIGGIQPFGALIAFSSDWIVGSASANVSEFLGVPHEDLVGSRLSDWILPNAASALRRRLNQLSFADAVERIFDIELVADRRFDVALHVSGNSFVLEVEHRQREQADHDASHVRPLIDRVTRASSLKEIYEIGAKQVRALTGFDRVMVYKFSPDGSGEVVAEARSSHLEPYLNLRYPASDIPKQARALYERNLLRIISDVAEEPVPIEPYLSPEGEPLDLSMSTLRASSPIHCEYLTNMGVHASMSISILRRGELWGLFACHHYAPRVVPYPTRTLCELFGQFYSYVLEQREGDEARMLADRASLAHRNLSVLLADSRDIAENFDVFAESLGEVIAFDGVALFLDGKIQRSGQTPEPDHLRSLAKFLNRAGASRIYASDHLAGTMPEAEAFVDRAAGVLAIPISRTPRDYLVLFRQEVARTVTWAGRPDKAVTHGPNGVRLTPRKSFEAWKETVSAHSLPWTDAEVAIAETLRVTMIEVILRLTDEAAQERAAAHERQELLIAELNHRVRNILNLIRGLVGQSRSDEQSIDDFVAVVGGRIQALARAHDQITQEQWQPGSLWELIETEAQAYSGEKHARVRVEGDDVLITPTAHTVLALVVHELLTNAMKYGALSDSAGSVAVRTVIEENGDLCLEWREQGGPAVQVPKRRGFGSTIIERSIPFELKGTAELHYELGGIKGRFCIPSHFVAGHAAPRTAKKAPAGPRGGVHGRVLIVEDNMIIGLDAEMMLQAMGAEDVVMASRATDALSELASAAFDFALLDVNLGQETSEPVAERLAALSVPFVFATGYGEVEQLTGRFDAPVVLKPFAEDALRNAFAKVAAKS